MVKVYGRMAILVEHIPGMHCPLAFLLTLLLINLHLRADWELAASKIKDFLNTQQGRTLEPASTVLMEMVHGDEHFRNEQKDKLQKLVMEIHFRRGSMILQAIVHPEPLRQANLYSFRMAPSHTVLDTRELLEKFEYDFDNTQGALGFLIDQFGRWPLYIGPHDDDVRATYCSTPESACDITLEDSSSLPAEPPPSVSQETAAEPTTSDQPPLFSPIQLLPDLLPGSDGYT